MPDRRVPIAEDLTALKRDGYPVFPALVEFLEYYSGLSLSVGYCDREDAIWFSAARACVGIAAAWSRTTRRERTSALHQSASVTEGI